MASPVQAKAVVLYAKIGSVYYPVACAKDASITTSAEFLELAARTSSPWREYEYGRLTGKINGSGITKVNTGGNLYSIFDVLGQQLSRLKFMVKFSANDPEGNYKVFECNVLVEEVNISGSAATLSNYTYSLQITGPLSVSSTPVENTNPQILLYEFVASGGETTLVIPSSANATIINVYVDGVALRVINHPGGYGAGQVQWNAATQTLTFGTALSIADYVKVIYVDVDAVSNEYALEDGNGNIIEDGSGNDILVQ
jgi:hypothetical protein